MCVLSVRRHGSEITTISQLNQVKRTPQDCINEFIIRKLNPLVVEDFRFMSTFLHASWAVNSHASQLLNFYPLKACLHEGGGPQVGHVTCGGLPHLTCKRDHIIMRDCMDRRVTSPKRVTSPTWGPPPPCKQALSFPEFDVNVFYQEWNLTHSKYFNLTKYWEVLVEFSHLI